MCSRIEFPRFTTFSEYAKAYIDTVIAIKTKMIGKHIPNYTEKVNLGTSSALKKIDDQNFRDFMQLTFHSIKSCLRGNKFGSYTFLCEYYFITKKFNKTEYLEENGNITYSYSITGKDSTNKYTRTMKISEFIEHMDIFSNKLIKLIKAIDPL